MSARCCGGGTASRRPARRLTMAATSVLPGAVLVLLPKCPLCLAAWLTVVTGVGFSTTGAAWVRGILAVLSVTVVAFVIWRSAKSKIGKIGDGQNRGRALYSPLACEGVALILRLLSILRS